MARFGLAGSLTAKAASGSRARLDRPVPDRMVFGRGNALRRRDAHRPGVDDIHVIFTGLPGPAIGPDFRLVFAQIDDGGVSIARG